MLGAVRLLLVLALVHGLAPGLAEVGEALVHWARTGHAAHTAADRGDLGDQGPEHGCGVTQHRCGCCVGLELLPAAGAAVALGAPAARGVLAGGEGAAPTRAPARPFRPPIA